MDTFGALMFGMLIIDVLKSRGIENVKQQTRYLAVAGDCCQRTGIGLYRTVSTGWHGGWCIANPQNGGELVAAYVRLIVWPDGLGRVGCHRWSGMSDHLRWSDFACADFFHTLWPRFSYKQCAAVIVILCAIVANVGLTQLLVISIGIGGDLSGCHCVGRRDVHAQLVL